jgi:hypothetical protein
MKKEEIIVGTKVWYYSTLGDSKKEEAVITSGPCEMCGTVCCGIDIRSSVVCIDNLEKMITALDSFKEIMIVMNKHRLIVPSDFDEESFMPDL